MPNIGKQMHCFQDSKHIFTVQWKVTVMDFDSDGLVLREFKRKQQR